MPLDEAVEFSKASITALNPHKIPLHQIHPTCVFILVMFQGGTMGPSVARAAKDSSKDQSENSWATNAVETKNVK